MISVYLIVCFLAFLIELDFYFISNIYFNHFDNLYELKYVYMCDT